MTLNNKIFVLLFLGVLVTVGSCQKLDIKPVNLLHIIRFELLTELLSFNSEWNFQSQTDVCTHIQRVVPERVHIIPVGNIKQVIHT